MGNSTISISVQVDKYDKELSDRILERIGIDMNAFVNMAIKQLIYTDGLPFKVKNKKPSKELLDSLKEGKLILQEIKDGNRKGYSNMTDLLNALNEK